jgi:hypothetical protein
MRLSRWISSIALLVAVALLGCRNDGQDASVSGNGTTGAQVASLTIPSGTSIGVTLNTSHSSKDANVGDAWSGSVNAGPDGIPTGSVVNGTVTGAKAARKGDRAMLDLGITSITVDGHQYPVHASTEAIIAGSTRARNLGAIAGSAVAGALIGKAVSGTTKGAVIGGVVGGGVATGVVAKSDGYQVLLSPGTALTFTTSEVLAVKN